MKRPKLLIVCAVVALAAPALAAASDPDDLYLQAFALIQKADTFAERNSVEEAVKTYESANAALASLHARYPAYNTRLVEYRVQGTAAAAANLRLPPDQRAECKPVASKQAPRA